MSQVTRLIPALFAVFVLAGAGTPARADTITFDTLTAMPSGPSGTAVPASGRLSTQLLGLGVRFSSTSDYVAVVPLGTGHATSGVNGIGGVSSAGQLSYLSPIRVTFFLPSDPSVLAVTNFVSIRGDLHPIPGSITMQAFDINGNLLGTVTRQDAGGTTLSLAIAGIHSIRLTQQTGTVAFDDLTFNTPVAAAAPVPEPAALVMFGTGLAGAGGVLRKRRRRANRQSTGEGR